MLGPGWSPFSRFSPPNTLNKTHFWNFSILNWLITIIKKCKKKKNANKFDNESTLNNNFALQFKTFHDSTITMKQERLASSKCPNQQNWKFKISALEMRIKTPYPVERCGAVEGIWKNRDPILRRSEIHSETGWLIWGNSRNPRRMKMIKLADWDDPQNRYETANRCFSPFFQE